VIYRSSFSFNIDENRMNLTNSYEHICGCKMRIAKYGEPDYAIHMPILLCEPLAGDYDGDLVTTFGPLTL
jgi:hypothetical protein